MYSQRGPERARDGSIRHHTLLGPVADFEDMDAVHRAGERKESDRFNPSVTVFVESKSGVALERPATGARPEAMASQASRGARDDFGAQSAALDVHRERLKHRESLEASIRRAERVVTRRRSAQRRVLQSLPLHTQLEVERQSKVLRKWERQQR